MKKKQANVEREKEREKREREKEKKKETETEMRNYMVEWRSGLKEQRQASGTQRVNAVIRSAAALRAPLTSLQNVKKNPRTLPKICQKVIKKYPKG